MPISIEKYRSPAAPDFFTSSSLSAFMLPGLGQFQAGERRKGLIFITAHIFNLAFLAFVLFIPALTGALGGFSHTYNLKLNEPLRLSFNELGHGSPLVLLSTLLFFSFALFAAYDAYYQKLKARRQAIYKGYVVAMPEAVSSSYICHATFLITCLILAFFFLVPLAPAKQITDIEFVQNEETAKERPVTQKRAEHNARAAGKLDQTKPLDTAKAASKSAASKSAQAKSAPARTLPNTSPNTSLSLSPKSTKNPATAPVPPLPVPHQPTPPDRTAIKPTLKPQLPALLANTLPTPVSKVLGSSAQAPVPQPALPTVPKIALAPPAVQLPRLSSAAASLSTLSAPNPKINSSPTSGAAAPQPLSLTSVSTAGGATSSNDQKSLHPQAIGRSPSGASGASGQPTPAADAPSPKRGLSNNDGPSHDKGQAMARPSLSNFSSGSGSGDHNNQNANRPGDSADASADIDWGPYMSALQKRIRLAWYPPRGPETKRVKVIFTVQSNGEMSNLRLIHGSGVAVVDAAALKAVENSAPFRHLPDHAPGSVDIEFTFDYNVFNGSLR